MTDLLVDTHVAVWFMLDDRRLGDRARATLASANARVSAASTWEVAIKMRLGKLDLDFEPGQSFADRCREDGFELVEATHADAWAVRDFPPRRADPFDRLLAATARRRGWTVITADPVFADLGVSVIDASL